MMLTVVTMVAATMMTAMRMMLTAASVLETLIRCQTGVQFYFA